MRWGDVVVEGTLGVEVPDLVEASERTTRELA